MTAGEMIEPIAVVDVYADDVAFVELLGPNVRLTYFTWQDGMRVVVCRLVRPRESIKGTVQRLVSEALCRQGGESHIELH